MNNTWLTLTNEKRRELLNQAAAQTSLPEIAIEKDWWVTVTLQACFELMYSPQIVFKGGTSLSKGWNLIERFSEDIDLAIDRKLFGFDGDISKNQIKNLRKKSCEFISSVFLADLTKRLSEWNIIDHCTLKAQPIADSDKDPQTVEIHYNSVFDRSDYLPQRVLIEVSSRSLIEPSDHRKINSILNVTFPDQIASTAFSVSSVLPQRTFLEKIFLLHEEFSQETKKIRIERLSRHLYDLEKLMDTAYGKMAIADAALYKGLVAHREKFNSLRGIDYSNHSPDKIKIIPPQTVIKQWETDYLAMTQNMIYGDTLNFDKLIKRLQELQERINAILH
jgi:hypothetical protein